MTKSDCSAARRTVAATDWLGRSNFCSPFDRAAAMSKGCVTVAAKARLRAARQSEQSFAPGNALRPQIKHFIDYSCASARRCERRVGLGDAAVMMLA